MIDDSYSFVVSFGWHSNHLCLEQRSGLQSFDDAAAGLVVILQAALGDGSYAPLRQVMHV